MISLAISILETIGNAGYLIQVDSAAPDRWRIRATNSKGEQWIILADDQFQAAVELWRQLGFEALE